MRQGLLSYGNGDEKKGTHSLVEGRPEHYYNSLSFLIIPYNSLSFLITISDHFFTIPLMVILFYVFKRPYLPYPGRFFFYPRLFPSRTQKSAQGNNF